MAMTLSTEQEPRWRRLPEERPQQILDAALAEFGERGLGAARLEDIAKRAGVSKGTIYLYFANKEELFRGVIRNTVVPQIERSERAVGASRESTSDTLRVFMRTYWTYIRSPQFAPIFRLVMAELHSYPDLARFYADEVVVRGHRLIAGLIKRGIDQGEFREVDPHMAARMLIAPFVLHGVWCPHADLFPWMAGKSDARVLQEMTDFFFAAVAVHPSPRKRPGRPRLGKTKKS